MRRRVRLLRIERMPAVIGLTAVIFAAWALAAAVVVPSSNLDHIGNLPGPPPQMVVTTQAADPGSSVATSVVPSIPGSCAGKVVVSQLAVG